jgi:hypothetical protein
MKQSEDGDKLNEDIYHLSNQFFIHINIALWPIKSLFQEGKQDGNDNTSLQGLSKHHEEHGNGKDIDGHLD